MGALGDIAGGTAADGLAALPGIRIACLPAVGIGDCNPYVRLVYEHLGERGFALEPRADLTLRWLWRHRRRVTFLHFQWQPDWYYLAKRRRYDQPLHRLPRLRSWARLSGFALRLRAARLFGYRLVWTIHEVYPPLTVLRPASLGRRYDRFGQRLLARRCHVLLAHHGSVADRAAAELRVDRARIGVVHHGAYEEVYPAGRPREEVREELGIPPDAFAFLAFGTLRPDKSIESLLAAFAGVRDPRAILIVAGRVEDLASLRALRAAAAADARVRPVLGFVPETHVGELFTAADASVLAREENWTSGSLILSLSLGLPAVCARLPAHVDLLDGRAGWLFEPGDRDGLRAALEAAAASTAWELNARRIAATAAARALPTWEEIAEQLAGRLLEAIGSEEELEELAMRVWPRLSSDSPVRPSFPGLAAATVREPEPVAPDEPAPAVAPARGT